MRSSVPFVVMFIAAALAGLVQGAAWADLDSFLGKPEPVYRWEKRAEQVVDVAHAEVHEDSDGQQPAEAETIDLVPVHDFLSSKLTLVAPRTPTTAAYSRE